MQHSLNIIEHYARDFTLSNKNADPNNWEWEAESRALWKPAGENWQNFRAKWYGVTERQSAGSPEFPSLSLEPLPNFDPSISSSIFVRESYVTMFKTVWAKAMSSKGRKGVIITGQPGIGKTLFLYYLLVQLLQRKQVILFSLDGEKLYLFYHSGVYKICMKDINGIDTPFPNPISDSSIFIWSLFDIYKLAEPERILFTYPCLPVQTATPNPIRYKIWQKERFPLVTGLPLWTRDELMQGLQHQYSFHSLLDALHKVYGSPSLNLIDPLDVCLGVRALLEEHYDEEGSVQPSPEDALVYLLDVAIDRFGYSARDVFGGVFDYPVVNRSHEMAFSIKCTDLYDAVSALSREESSSEILALSPVDEGPLLGVRWDVDFKSTWVAKSVIQRLSEAEDNEEIRRQICMLQSIPGAGALVGRMLEPLAHRYITNATNNFLLFNMESNDAEPPHFTLVRDSPVPNNQRFIKVKRKIVRLRSIDNLSSCLDNRSYYVPDDPNFPLFDAFTIDLDHAKKSAILWVLQMTTSRKRSGSQAAKGYQKIHEIMTILRNELQEPEEPPLKKSKTMAEEPVVQVRYLLVVPKDESQSQSQNLQWDFPKGWNQNGIRNDHRGPVYCLEVPLTVSSKNVLRP